MQFSNIRDPKRFEKSRSDEALAASDAALPDSHPTATNQETQGI
jgi:hypothetical protein